MGGFCIRGKGPYLYVYIYMQIIYIYLIRFLGSWCALVVKPSAHVCFEIQNIDRANGLWRATAATGPAKLTFEGVGCFAMDQGRIPNPFLDAVTISLPSKKVGILLEVSFTSYEPLVIFHLSILHIQMVFLRNVAGFRMAMLGNASCMRVVLQVTWGISKAQASYK